MFLENKKWIVWSGSVQTDGELYSDRYNVVKGI